MNRIRGLLTSLVGLAALAALALVIVWVYKAQSAVSANAAQTGSAAAPSSSSPIPPPAQAAAPEPTPTQTAIPVDWTDVGPAPTAEPTPTIPPVPTPLPTPVVTPIPAAQPPFIPGLEAVERQPFRIFLRQGNQVWVMNDDGSDKRLLVDTAQAAGLYIAHHPLAGIEGPSLQWGSVSPDGNTIALTVTSTYELEYKGQPYTWDIYLLDVATGELTFLAEGRNPVWSPDGQRLACVAQSLSVIDIMTGSRQEVFVPDEGFAITDVAWSADGSRLAFVHAEASHMEQPSILVFSTEGVRLGQVESADLYAPTGLTWLGDADTLLFSSADFDTAGLVFTDLRSVSLATGDVVRLTDKTYILSSAVSPVTPDWIAFVGQKPYEIPEVAPGEAGPPPDIWLVDRLAGESFRVTDGFGDIRDVQWAPDGAALIFRLFDGGIYSEALADGSVLLICSDDADFVVAR